MGLVWNLVEDLVGDLVQPQHPDVWSGGSLVLYAVSGASSRIPGNA